MASQNVVLLCRWGGEIMCDGSNVEYSGGNMELITLEPNMTVNDLMNEVHSSIGSNPMNAELNLKMRCETGHGVQVLHVSTNKHLKALRSIVIMKGVPNEIYVETVPICTQQSTWAEQHPTYVSDYNTASFQGPSNHIPSNEYGMGTFSRLLHDDQFQMPFSPHIASPAHAGGCVTMFGQSGPSTSNTVAPSPMREEVQESPSQEDPSHFDNIVNNELSVYDVYADTDDEDDNGEEYDRLDDMDLEDGQMEIDEPLVRTAVPWFSQINENYEVDEYWANSGSHTSFVPGGEFEKGMYFDSKKTLQEMVKMYSIQRNQFYTTVTSNESVLHLRCKKKCGWSLRGTRTSEHSRGFTILTYKGPHRENCVTELLSNDHPHLDSSIISEFVKSFVQKDPTLKVEFIQELISKQFHFEVPYKRAWYAKDKAITQIFGDWESSYSRLPQFMQALQQSNQGTVVIWKHKALVEGRYTSNMEVFERVFWAFGPCIDGFKHCMPVICIDGTHLYGKYKGTLLVATGVDGNFQVFPLAFALVEGENISSWSWFMSCLRDRVTQRDGLCVIFDRHAGIIAAMNDLNIGFTQPRAYHRFCVRHLASNLKSHVRSTITRDTFKAAAYQRQERKLQADLFSIGQACTKSLQYIAQVSFPTWSLFHDGGRRHWICTTNFYETFNNVLKGARFMPVMSLVELTFHRVNRYFTLRRESAETRAEQGLAYPPKVTAILEKNTAKARYHKVDAYNSHRHTVNFQLRTCTCNKPLIFHLPCSHVLAVCATYSLSERPWVDPFLQSDAYMNTYAPQFWPIPCETTWTQYIGPRLIPDAEEKVGQSQSAYAMKWMTLTDLGLNAAAVTNKVTIAKRAQLDQPKHKLVFV
ncbi:uncharacterized protein LOC110735155 [Chenopodium quinoa]|uniref:uncharacterized protein LOC110735155 n=1 Tax=Chenopodium quinoa TaxID=63459 RepID=UPI000B777157|nr:uncharacterized protein LOC110735155 [Chenopodium quinoa]XP_021771014.1 uncharacterized protein LOC110735155 [Chenopodium quinoa]